VSAIATGRIRARARVHGTVQGVGFRPYVYRLAHECRLAGFVLNDASGVLLEVEGEERAVDDFLARLPREAPPLAAVKSVSVTPGVPTGESGFSIRDSPRGGVANAAITPDTATCEHCLAELLDPADRRHRYPFINCTNCGPRFTIVQGIPYDRPFSTMAGFTMCSHCQAEYDDPGDRRFHAQPNACPVCGPAVQLLGPSGAAVDCDGAIDAVHAAARALVAGRIVAVKGIGGYHLACRADDEEAVATLRARKHREDKPFALMAVDVAAARSLVVLGAAEESLLPAARRPIVLAPRRPEARVAAAVAPGAPELGVMLPYTPLHHLLLRDSGTALVMTSGNLSDEPIAFHDADALERLAPIADLLLTHDRPIETRTDDSVVRAVSIGEERRPLFLRRSRGYVPEHHELPVPATRPLLACGAEQKNTFCVAKASRAWVSHHIGDLEHFATHQAFRQGVVHFERMFAVAPELIAHDLHPGYLSTTYAFERDDLEFIGVQHHHAHLAACLAEHGRRGPAVGAIFDGTGYGLDGCVWGGELLVGDLASFERAGHLLPVRMPGGAAAIREPWRMAFAWLSEALGEAPSPPVGLADEVAADAWRSMSKLAVARELSPMTTSVGRLFDAVAAICGLRARVNYEGQAAVELEALAAGAGAPRHYEIELVPELILDPRAAIRAIADDVAAGFHASDVAAGFHAAMTAVTVDACARLAADRGLDRVVLSGGVFQNRLLLESAAGALVRGGLEVLVPTVLPPNDGGISFGQAAVAAASTAGR
jgi:hydrogenase maturation protein HypF